MNNYVFIRVVGKGSYGEVNLVKHRADRKQYVIKKLNLTKSTKRERRAAEQEAKLLSQLRHPNIVTYRESWEGEDCQLYIVMGFCEGGDLYHRLKQQKGDLLPERQVVEWFVQIAMALQYLHEKHILHRDLKTQNIFLTKTNIIKVGDLGIARVLENQNDMASTLIGTPYYMSPELFSNKPYNHKSDVWALGCCVYEMSTLKHAFNAKDMNSLVYRIVQGKLPQMPGQYDPLLGELIRSMLCKRPEERPDVKLILREPYIKRQIAMFLEATKEKTAKSRRKAVDGAGDAAGSRAGSGVSPQPKRPPQSPPGPPLPRPPRRDGDQNGHAPTPPARSPSPDPAPEASSFSSSLATVSSITIDIEPVEQQQPPGRGEGPAESPAQRPPSAVSGPPNAPRPGPHAAPRDRKHKRKPEPSRRGEGEEEGRSRGSPGPSHAVEAQSDKPPPSAADDMDDTMELLKESALENPPLGPSAALSAAGVHSSADEEKEAAENPSNGQEILESTEKLLEPFPAIAAMEQHEDPSPSSHPVSGWDGRCAPGLVGPHLSLEPSMSQQHRQREDGRMLVDQLKSRGLSARPLPPPPAQTPVGDRRKRSRVSTEKKKTPTATSSSSSTSPSGGGLLALPQAPPLSARERRRLRQSQEQAIQPVVHAVRRASYDVTTYQSRQQDVRACRSVSECGDPLGQNERLHDQRSEEDDCSSSTSSTERSEGDGREGRKTESTDMHDLVQMMTQTLRMDGRERVNDIMCESTALPEFKLNRKYRDTLVLHGKAWDQTDFPLNDLPSGTTSGPAKIRRAIEYLRTDVVKGLGVKLLDKVLELMDEEDDHKRQVCLREQMGEEKYLAYAVMVRQLKFFEDISFKG
ncbi:serine/threonine-protein kinase Nek4 isoform X2 [Gadus morhua]|uniref:serine/threonine-protein kinase Nek4 isoform X2 n=1 Tax=Gadus morhua TaxID=8049 RepID=UPI0011B7D2F1|nr:serine/threonine-protein kinase Nek4 isoform X2 [Gadus morhua]